MCEVGSQAAHAHQSALLKPHHGAQATYTKQPLPKPPQGILPCQRQTWTPLPHTAPPLERIGRQNSVWTVDVGKASLLHLFIHTKVYTSAVKRAWVDAETHFKCDKKECFGTETLLWWPKQPFPSTDKTAVLASKIMILSMTAESFRSIWLQNVLLSGLALAWTCAAISMHKNIWEAKVQYLNRRLCLTHHLTIQLLVAVSLGYYQNCRKCFYFLRTKENLHTLQNTWELHSYQVVAPYQSTLQFIFWSISISTSI